MRIEYAKRTARFPRLIRAEGMGDSRERERTKLGTRLASAITAIITESIRAGHEHSRLGQLLRLVNMPTSSRGCKRVIWNSSEFWTRLTEHPRVTTVVRPGFGRGAALKLRTRVRWVCPSDRAHARGWRTYVPSEPRTHVRGHGLRSRSIGWCSARRVDSDTSRRTPACDHGRETGVRTGRSPPTSHVSAILAPDRADARGWRTFVPSEPRTHVRGHGLRSRPVLNSFPRSAWECRLRRSASLRLPIADNNRSGRGASRTAFPRGAWERVDASHGKMHR